MPMMLDDKVLNELRGIRDKIGEKATLLADVLGEDHPAAKAYRDCHSMLYATFQRRGL